MTHTYRNICYTQTFTFTHTHVHTYRHTCHIHMHTGVYATHIGTHVAHSNIFTHRERERKEKKDWPRAQFIEALGLRLSAFPRGCGNSGRF